MSVAHLAAVKLEGAVPVAHLSESDMEYHAEIVGEIKTLGQLEVQARAIQQEMLRIQGARETWMRFLLKKYGLKDGDGIEADGTIIRNPIG